MIYKVLFRPAARRDLLHIYSYIKHQSASTYIATDYIQYIKQHCESLATLPERGKRRDDIRKGLRTLAFEKRIIIAFMIDGDTVRIGRILSYGRDYEAVLLEQH
jgi:toxin ParE1/3/4